jgi:catechol 2,3-dioxygenase-like lactoylglutathione lyase family enzyme
MAKVTGVGGVFFRVRDPAATAAWYREHLGMDLEAGYPMATIHSNGGETTVWAPFDQDTEYFGDQGQQFMVNYRVDDLGALLDQLRAADVEVLDEREDDDNGRFAWIVDCDGRRVELWQPLPGN